MKKLITIEKYLLTAALILVAAITSTGQTDTTNIAKAPNSIGDSTITADSILVDTKPKSFLVKFEQDKERNQIAAYTKRKKEIDFSDYRYSGNIISLIPFGYLNDLGSLGTPSEANIFNFGQGNISLSFDENIFTSSWNNSIDLNRIQTEDINSFELIPIHRAFLYGFNSNPAHIQFASIDNLKSKPISRIRYYQASNDEGFIDAFFSARVMSKLSLSLRVTNNSIDNNFINSESGNWKFKFRGVYKLADSLFAGIKYYHLKLNTPLNGGVDISSLSLNTEGEYDIYNNINPVVFNERDNTTTLNNAGVSLFGNIFPAGYSTITFSYLSNQDKYSQNYDTITVKNKNSYYGIRSSIMHKMTFENLFVKVSGGFENIDYEIDGIDYRKKLSNYYTALYSDYSMLSGRIRPAAFWKYSQYNGQNLSGYGTELNISVMKNLDLQLGYSNFEKPVTIVEEKYVSPSIEQRLSNIFTSISYINKNIHSSLSYFKSDGTNIIVPIMNTENDIPSLNEIVFFSFDKLSKSGLNLFTEVELWNILVKTNLNYYWSDNDIYDDLDDTFTLQSGIYYVDTLFNSNLNLKTGFTFYYFDNKNMLIYDFQKMRSAQFQILNGQIEKLPSYSVINDKYRLDFFLAGRIQDAATFYFIYENLLNNKYFSVPYYPMPEGGIRIGISWDFLD